MVGGDNESMIAAIRKLFEIREENGGDGEGVTDDVDAAVFRQQYIPQTLEQVYDVERDAEKVQYGESADLVYRDLLADKSKAAIPSIKAETKAQLEEEDESDQSGGVSISDGSDESAGGSDDEDPFAKKPPRGKKHEDKDAKRLHKQKVKEEKREQRAKKMPKHVKKKIINSTKRK